MSGRGGVFPHYRHPHALKMASIRISDIAHLFCADYEVNLGPGRTSGHLLFVEKFFRKKCYVSFQ